MFSRENIALLDELGTPYIIAARLKNMSAAWKEKISATNATQPNDANADQLISEWDYGNGRRLIVTFSHKRAKKDRLDRETAVKKLRAKIAKSKNPASLISNYGYKSFLRVKGDARVVLDEKKLAQAACWDGLHGVITNSTELSASQAVEQCRLLWQIEDCFRLAKHDLRIRPIFHWAPARVHAHILICFLVLVCIRSLADRVLLRFESMSPARIVRALNAIQASILLDSSTKRPDCLPSRFNDDARKLYTTMALTVDSTPYEITKN